MWSTKYPRFHMEPCTSICPMGLVKMVTIKHFIHRTEGMSIRKGDYCIVRCVVTLSMKPGKYKVSLILNCEPDGYGRKQHLASVLQGGSFASPCPFSIPSLNLSPPPPPLPPSLSLLSRNIQYSW